MSANNLPEGVTAFLDKYESKIELVLWSFVGITFILGYIQSDQYSTFAGLSLTTLSMFYFLSAFTNRSDTKIMKVISGKVVNIASSVCLVGIMYNMLNLSGANMMFSVGLISMIFAGAIIILTSLSDWNDKTTRIILRIILIAVIGISF